MELSFSAEPADLRPTPPRMDKASPKVARSEVTDTDGNPFILRIQTVVNTDIHNAKTRGYVDLDIPDDRTLKLLQSVEAQLVDVVFTNQSNSDWFGEKKRAPRGVIETMLSRIACSSTKKPHPYLQIKTTFKDGAPYVNHVIASPDTPNDTTTSVLHDFSDLQGTPITYEVQLSGVRFNRTQFNPELNLLRVTSLMDVKSFDMLEGILDNDNHRDRKERILQQKERMQQYEAQRAELEDMKQAVESEVHAAMARKEDIDTRYKTLLESIEQSRIEYEAGIDEMDTVAENDVAVDDVAASESKENTAVTTDGVGNAVESAATMVAEGVQEVTELALVPVNESGATGEPPVNGETTTDAALMGE